MKCAEFLKHDTIPFPSVWCFTGESYPALFFSQLLTKTGVSNHAPLPLENLELSTVHSALETTFLGSVSFYWLGNVSEEELTKKKKLIAYLSHYTGPHAVGFFLETSDAEKIGTAGTHVILDDSVNQALYVSLSTKFGFQPDPEFVNNLFKHHKTISCDTACIMLQYQAVIGKKHAQFFDSWVNTIIDSEKAPFLLTQYFFEKNSKKFWVEWESIKHHYSDEYWISLWSDQLWQATLFIEEVKKTNAQEARKLVKRLPFSFMQKDWRTIKPAELAHAHDFLYTIDHSNKNGGSADVGLELLYNKFFLNQFT